MSYIAYTDDFRILAGGKTADEARAAGARECGEDEDRIMVMAATPRLVEWVDRHGGDERSVSWEESSDSEGQPYADLAEDDDSDEDEEASNYVTHSAADVAEVRLTLVRDKMGLNRAYWPGRPADVAEVIAAGQEDPERVKRRVRDLLKESGRTAPTTQELYALEAAVKVDPVMAFDAAASLIAVAGGARYVAQEAITWAEEALASAIKEAASLDDLAGLLTQAAEVGVECDHTSLPTFGGEEPEAEGGVFSWDADRLLVHGREGVRGWEIEPRGDL